MNHLMSNEAAVKFVEHRTGYSFTNKALALEALILNTDPLQSVKLTMGETGERVCVNSKSDRLALVGTSILEATLTSKWYATRHSKETMYYIRESLTTVDALAQRGFKCGIDQAMLRNSCQEHEKPGRKCMATTVKAIVGAALIDGGEKAVDRVMNGLGFYEDEWFKELMGDVKMKEDVNKDELEGLSTKMERL